MYKHIEMMLKSFWMSHLQMMLKTRATILELNW